LKLGNQEEDMHRIQRGKEKRNVLNSDVAIGEET